MTRLSIAASVDRLVHAAVGESRRPRLRWSARSGPGPAALDMDDEEVLLDGAFDDRVVCFGILTANVRAFFDSGWRFGTVRDVGGEPTTDVSWQSW